MKLHQKKDKAKHSDPGGISDHFGAAMRAPMAVGVQYAHPRLR